MKQWQDVIRRSLKAELKRRRITYKELSRRLEAMGVTIRHGTLGNMICRGRMSAAKLAQLLAAIGCTEFKIEARL